MIRLARHIEILLLGNECVIVPNLGGFVAHHLTARYDMGEGLFLPPYRTLGFNPQLKMNDSLLAQSYAEAYDLSFPEAVDAIEDEVRELLRIMGDSGSYELENLGRLYYDKDGRMNFSAYESGILTPEFYALGSFEMPMLSAAVKNEKAASTEKDKLNGTTSDASSDTSSEDEKPAKTINISLRAVRNFTIAAAVIATVLIASFPLAKNNNVLSSGKLEGGFYEMFFNGINKQQPNTVQPFKTVKKAESPKATTAKPVSSKPEVAAPIKSKSEKKTVAEEEVKTVQPHWSIVICSHVSKKNAEILSDKLQKDGFKDVSVSTTGATKVLYGSYETKGDALNHLNKLRDSNEKFKDAWLLEVKE